MSLYDAIRPLAFLLPPETAHNLALEAISRGWITSRRCDHPSLAQNLFGVDFPNPIGLAAGFDKNAVAIKAWPRFGFGFTEIGTITARPQPGNPKPRLFRYPEAQALINRMGFNNDGAEEVAERLVGLVREIPVGINMGKSKVATLEQAAEDYLATFRKLAPFGSYFVVNVSSPNTPGLRTLQDKRPLRDILLALRRENGVLPLFVKISPDLEEAAIEDIIEVGLEAQITGLIATNTTTCREGLTTDPGEAGGLSGAPLRDRSLEVLRTVRRLAPASMILIGVGGIFTADDVWDRIVAGAHLVQIYTGWVYGGPELVPDLLEDLVARMDRQGVRHISELRGT